jgi:hypothetical protein
MVKPAFHETAEKKRGNQLMIAPNVCIFHRAIDIATP